MSEINPWVRADYDTYNSETLILIPDNLREEYARIMKQLAHTRAVAALALEQVILTQQSMFEAENQRSDFFNYVKELENGS